METTLLFARHTFCATPFNIAFFRWLLAAVGWFCRPRATDSLSLHCVTVSSVPVANPMLAISFYSSRERWESGKKKQMVLCFHEYVFIYIASHFLLNAVRIKRIKIQDLLHGALSICVWLSHCALAFVSLCGVLGWMCAKQGATWVHNHRLWVTLE